MKLIDGPSAFGLAAMSLVCGSAWWFGGPLERRGAAWIAAAWVMTPLLQVLTGDYDPVVLFSVVDVTTLLGLAALTWRSGRAWPMVAVGAQALGTGVDLVRLFQPHMNAWSYLTALTLAAYVLLAALAAGTWTHARALRRGRESSTSDPQVEVVRPRIGG